MPESLSKFAILIKCLLGPRLYRTYRDNGRQGLDYSANNVEFYTDVVIKSLDTVIWNFGFYTSPILLSYLYRRGHFTFEGLITACKLLSAFGGVLLFAISLRGVGRFFNPQYISFISTYHHAIKSYSKDSQKLIRMYDFDFHYWPIDYKHKQPNSPERLTKRSFGITALPCEIIAYVVAHVIGRPMLYPGSVQLFQVAMGPMLLQGRTNLIERVNAKRNKVATFDGNHIDTVFIDKRPSEKGNILVICCEGNAGFYEQGTLSTPVEAGYSTLGWNHPGFGGSTGLPFPEQETAAVDAVMQFSIEELGFPVENIVLYAWSIGGYPASWVAMNYPDIKALILDATFDDLIPLAVAKMPPSWKPLVVRTVKRYLNLNIIDHVTKYHGPITIFRRTKDEIITLVEFDISTNRGNDLLISLLKYRYPKLMDESTLPVLENWLTLNNKTKKQEFINQTSADDDLCKVTIMSHIGESKPSYPLTLGEGLDLDMKKKLVIFLARKYMIDFEATHCIPLPANFFKMPWDPVIGN